MWSWYNVITSWDIKQYVYCPAIPWIARNYNIIEPSTMSMRFGREEGNNLIAKLRKIGVKDPIRLNVQMYSTRLKAVGIADAISGKTRLTVIEVKKFPRKKYKHFIAQLMFYAVLSEECIGPTYKAILIIGDAVKLYEITHERLSEAKSLMFTVKRIIKSEYPPKVDKTPKCYSCWYRRYCPIY